MKWQGRQGSGNIEDRRGMSGGKIALGGGVGTICCCYNYNVSGGDPSQLLNGLQGGAETEQVSTSAEEDQMITICFSCSKRILKLGSGENI